MGKIGIIVDSNADLPDEILEEYDIGVVPIDVTIGGINYGMTRDYLTYYEALDACKTAPATTAITPACFEEWFERYHKNGYTDLIYISMSSTGSSTFNNAHIARDWFAENRKPEEHTMNIYLLDSLNYSIAYGYAAVRAAKVRKDGGSISQIIDAACEWIDKLEVCLTAFSLEHIRRSGRIGNAMATVGRALGIRPILKVVDGFFSLISAVRGNNNAVSGVVDYFRANHVDGTDYVVLRGTSDGPAMEVIDHLQRISKKAPALYTFIGPLTAINIGPKMTGIGFMSNRKTKK